MVLGHCALLWFSLPFALAVIPIEKAKPNNLEIGRLEFEQLPNSESHKRPITNNDLLTLFPLGPQEGKLSRKRVPIVFAGESQISKRLKPSNSRADYSGHDKELLANWSQKFPFHISPTWATTATATQFNKAGPPADIRRVLSATTQNNLPAHLDLQPIPQELLDQLQRAQFEPRRKGQSSDVLSHPIPSLVQPIAREEQDVTILPSLRRPVENLDGSWFDLSENRKIRQYYSCQILDWSPPVIDYEPAAIAIHSMATRFQQAITGFPPAVALGAMHTSHQILVPFIYKLLMKRLTQEHWSRVLLVWRNLWYDAPKELEPSPSPSPNEFLSKFLWITDFISEATIPELFQDANRILTAGNQSKDPFQLMTNEGRILKILSDGRRPLQDLSQHQKTAIDHIKDVMTEQLDRVNRNHEESSDLASPWELILERLRSQAHSITQLFPAKKTEEQGFSRGSWSWFRENLWERAVYKPGTATRTMCFYLQNYPAQLRDDIVKLFQFLKFDNTRLKASPSAHLRHGQLIKIFDGGFHVHLITHGSLNQERPDLLPRSIHNYFDQVSKKLKN
ncbi:hypothetical protein PSTG_02780 [Puccinia striiformis f. sp. tritici PST-78]|uniref:Uncharacterized protein n=1 Tax=Puccinia striiformis f. sp. tritici PST-78 TaxID=1165861 RepID=A0A0L0VYJ6_9BASI|nr:hypothetical protein PSTG_02780 [Puccinia striiformis f. sp. tritici PST-78]